MSVGVKGYVEWYVAPIFVDILEPVVVENDIVFCSDDLFSVNVTCSLFVCFAIVVGVFSICSEIPFMIRYGSVADQRIAA